MLIGLDSSFRAYLIRRNQGELAEAFEEYTKAIQGGEIVLPSAVQTTSNFSGGINHCPDSDLSYSKDAATVPGTLPGDGGDGNQEAYRFYRQEQDADLILDDAHALKAVGHASYAAVEGMDSSIPDWNRVDGWIEIGSEGTQYDIAVQLLGKIVGPGQRWFVRMKLAALTPDLLPSGIQAFAGFWHKTGLSEGYIEGSPFDLNYEIVGAVGSASIEYRVLAKTDSGVSILSNVLTVPDAPDALSASSFVRIFHSAGPGFVTFEIYRKLGSVYSHLFTVRNSVDLYYNDDGQVRIGGVQGWPVVSGNAPRAYAETRTLRVAAYAQTWKTNDLTIAVPASYDYSQTAPDGLFLRFGLTSPTGVDRQVGIDRIYLSTTYNDWSPDVLPPFPDGTFPVPSISPTSGNQGAGPGAGDPPSGGGGGATCVRVSLPVLMMGGRFKQLKNVNSGDRVRGEHREAYTVLDRRVGTAAEFYRIRTSNGITYECNGDHRLLTDWSERRFITAREVATGMKLPAWVKGRKTYTKVKSIELFPEPVEVGTFVLRHPLERDGHGIFIAGRSKGMDRGLPSSNVKIIQE